MQWIDTFISITKVIIACLFLSMPHIFGFLFFIQPAQGKLHNIVSLIYKFKCMYTLSVLQYHVHKPYPYHYQRDARKMVKLWSNRKKTKEDMEEKKKERIQLKSQNCTLYVLLIYNLYNLPHHDYWMTFMHFRTSTCTQINKLVLLFRYGAIGIKCLFCFNHTITCHLLMSREEILTCKVLGSFNVWC